MLDNLRIEALTHNCAKCAKHLTVQHLVIASYWVKSVKDFSQQLDIGIIGANVRNVWVHLNCEKPLLTSWDMTPDIHICVRCKKSLGKEEIVQPVFQVINPRAVNPNDPSDVGIALNDRVYFVHCDCTNTTLRNDGSNLIVTLQ